MKTLDHLYAEIQRRDLFISNLTERLSPSLEWEALCFLKRRDWTAFNIGVGRTVAEAIEAALAKFGPERKPKAADEFEDLLG